MTALNKQALRELYSSQPVPKCHICGAEMTIQRAGGGSLVYGCTGRVDSDGEGYVFAEGRDFADNHYALSRVTVANNSDPDVLAMLDELEAAEKRIAELEAREIKPAKGEVIVVVSGFTGCGKSAIAGEIEIAMKAIGVPVQWTNGDAEKRMTGADWLTAIEMYKPTVRIVEVNVPRAAGIGVKGD
ncbi:ead/Ea22-like family protein [Citrobacter youngae]|uniref:ead/Ea22-like family protein n=1 Tax=Citrobacter youngae TaxID=133448 RepID=UPI003978659F